MKRTIIALVAVLAAGILAAHAQYFPKKYIETHKYGKVTPAEFDESTYPESVRDDDVVILEHTDDIILSVDSIYRDAFGGTNQLVKYYNYYRTERYKIKIRKESGLKYADIELLHRHIAKPTDHVGFLYGVQGCTYNMKGDKVVDSKLKPRHISNRMLDDSTQQISFTMPDVAVGSIIEYEFERKYVSTYPIDREVILQHDRPILKSRCIVSMVYVNSKYKVLKAFLSDCYGDIPYRTEKGYYGRYFKKLYTEGMPEWSRDDPFGMRTNLLYRMPSKSDMMVPTISTIYEAENIPPLSAVTDPEKVARIKILVL